VRTLLTRSKAGETIFLVGLDLRMPPIRTQTYSIALSRDATMDTGTYLHWVREDSYLSASVLKGRVKRSCRVWRCVKLV
jgi:hypothetical protein